MEKERKSKWQENIYISGVLAWYEVKQWRNDYRVWALASVLLVLLVKQTLGFTIYGVQYGTKTTPWFLSLLFADATVSNGLTKVLLYLGVIVLFCNAPFINQLTPYLILRGKKKAWAMGEMVYIFLASAIYLLFLLGVTILVLLPSMSISQMWGSTIYDLYNGIDLLDVVNFYGNGTCIPGDLIRKIYPEAALSYTLLTAWLSFSSLGLLMFALNMCSRSHTLGIAVVAALVLLDPVIAWIASWGNMKQWLFKISPVNWTSVENLRIVSSMGSLTVSYVIVAQITILVILICIILWNVRRMEIQVGR